MNNPFTRQGFDAPPQPTALLRIAAATETASSDDAITTLARNMSIVDRVETDLEDGAATETEEN
jgi:hypothetical protein